MACETLHAIILSLPNNKKQAVHSPRTAAVKACVEEVLEACRNDQNNSRFAAFSEHLVALLMSTLQSSASSLSQQRKRLWVNFFKLRSEKLLSLWRAFLQDISCSSAVREPLFMELVNESLLQKLCKNMIPTPQSDKSRLDIYLLKDEHAEHYKICLWLRRDETVQSICQAAW